MTSPSGRHTLRQTTAVHAHRRKSVGSRSPSQKFSQANRIRGVRAKIIADMASACPAAGRKGKPTKGKRRKKFWNIIIREHSLENEKSRILMRGRHSCATQWTPVLSVDFSDVPQP